MAALRWPTNQSAALRYCRDVFAEVAPRYDLMKALMSVGLERLWKRRSFGSLPHHKPSRCLDLACGTGDFTELLCTRWPRATVTSFDLSPEMIGRARSRNEATMPRFVRGDLNQLPFATDTFDVLTVGYGLRYVHDLESFIGECRRILRPGGVFLSLDLGWPKLGILRPIWQGYLLVTGTVLGWLLHGESSTYWHIVQSLRSYPGQDWVRDRLEAEGFVELHQHDYLGGVAASHIARNPAG